MTSSNRFGPYQRSPSTLRGAISATPISGKKMSCGNPLLRLVPLRVNNRYCETVDCIAPRWPVVLPASATTLCPVQPDAPQSGAISASGTQRTIGTVLPGVDCGKINRFRHCLDLVLRQQRRAQLAPAWCCRKTRSPAATGQIKGSAYPSAELRMRPCRASIPVRRSAKNASVGKSLCATQCSRR